MNLTSVISPDQFKALSASGLELVLLDARPDAGAWTAGHLPGAVHASLDHDLSGAAAPGFDPARGGRHPLPPLTRWLRRLGEWGIGPETYVVVYDDLNGANAAARAWWMLRSIGHEKVSVLDGGLQNALKAGLKMTTDQPAVASRTPYPASQWHDVVDIDRVEKIRTDPQTVIIDVRSAERFRGETEPIDPVAGHIPGARNLPFAENQQNGVFKSAEQLREQYSKVLGGATPDRVVVHCGSGVTACHTLLALDRAGLHGASLYVGSWSEWCRSDRPLAPEKE